MSGEVHWGGEFRTSRKVIGFFGGNLTVYFRVCFKVACYLTSFFFSVVVIIMFANARPNWAHQQVPGFCFSFIRLKFQFQLVYFLLLNVLLFGCECVR